jgi:hypothetical protein
MSNSAGGERPRSPPTIRVPSGKRVRAPLPVRSPEPLRKAGRHARGGEHRGRVAGGADCRDAGRRHAAAKLLIDRLEVIGEVVGNREAAKAHPKLAQSAGTSVEGGEELRHSGYSQATEEHGIHESNKHKDRHSSHLLL